jgi:hypothetical protein
MYHNIEYNPRTKHNIQSCLFTLVYEPLSQHLEQELDTIIDRNTSMGSFSQPSFHYRAVHYRHSTTKSLPQPGLGRHRAKRNPLLPVLHPQMNDWIQAHKESELERTYVLAYITKVLNTSEGFPDYYRLFPEALHPTLDRLKEACPCRHQELSEESINAFLQQNILPQNLIKERLLRNLLI